MAIKDAKEMPFKVEMTGMTLTYMGAAQEQNFDRETKVWSDKINATTGTKIWKVACMGFGPDADTGEIEGFQMEIKYYSNEAPDLTPGTPIKPKDLRVRPYSIKAKGDEKGAGGVYFTAEGFESLG